MLTKSIAVAILLLSSKIVMAQSDPLDSTASEIISPWTKSWIISLRGNQANYSDWSMGGVNSSAFVATSKFKTEYTWRAFTNTLRSDLRYGRVYQKGSGAEKTEDLILLSNKIDYAINDGAWRAFLEVSFRTQFTKGFDGNGDLISDFLSPGYLIESLGILYQPNDLFSMQLGAGLKQTTVNADGLDDYYGLIEDQDVRWEGGVTFALIYEVEIFKNFTFETELTTFTNVTLPLVRTDIFMTNLLTGEINSFLTSTLEWSFIYDDDFGEVLQSMRVISLGIQVNVFRD